MDGDYSGEKASLLAGANTTSTSFTAAAGVKPLATECCWHR